MSAGPVSTDRAPRNRRVQGALRRQPTFPTLRAATVDLTALLLLALVDSVNPSALVVTLMLLARPGGARAVVPYVAGIYVS